MSKQLTPRKSEGSKLHKLYEFTELKNLLMAEICDLKTNDAPDSESNSKIRKYTSQRSTYKQPELRDTISKRRKQK